MVKRRRRRYDVDENGQKVDGPGKVVKKVRPGEDIAQDESEETTVDLLVYRGGTKGDFLVPLGEDVEKVRDSRLC